MNIIAKHADVLALEVLIFLDALQSFVANGVVGNLCRKVVIELVDDDGQGQERRDDIVGSTLR